MESYITYENLEAARAEFRRLKRLHEREQKKNEAILQAIENSNLRINDLKKEVKELRKARIRANKSRLRSALEAEVEAAITAATFEMQNNLEVNEVNLDNHPLPRSSSAAAAATTNDLFSSRHEEHHNQNLPPPPPSSIRNSFTEWTFFTFKWILMIFGIMICLFAIFLIGQWFFMSIYTGSLLAFSGYRAPLVQTRYEPIYVYRGWSLPYWSFSWGYAFGGYDNYYHSHDTYNTYNVWNSNANEPRSRGWFSRWSGDEDRPRRGWFSREDSEPRRGWFSWGGNDPEEPRSNRGWFSKEETEPRKSWFSWGGNVPEEPRSNRGWFGREGSERSEEADRPGRSWFSSRRGSNEEKQSPEPKSRSWFNRQSSSEDSEPRSGSSGGWFSSEPEQGGSSREPPPPPPPSYSSHEPYYNDGPSSGPELRGSPSSGSF